MSEPTPQVVERPGGPSSNRSQDAYEELRELLRRIEVFPSGMRVDWATEGREAPVVVGALSVVDVLRINRALKRAFTGEVGERDNLIRARMAQLNRDRRATPPPTCLESEEAGL